MTTYFVRESGDGPGTGPYEAEVIRSWIEQGRLAGDAQCSEDRETWTAVSDVSDLRPAMPVPATSALATGAPRADEKPDEKKAAAKREPALADPAPKAASAATTAAVALPDPGPNPAPLSFPEITLFIRQGANVQGPYSMTRIRGYVVQRRVQPYMLFSQDGVFWVGPEHVPGLIPEGYVALPPPSRPTAVPTLARAAAPSPTPSAARAAAQPAARPTPRSEAPPTDAGESIGSTTLYGFRLDEAEAAAPSTIRASSAPATVSAPVESGPPSYYVRLDGQSYGPCTEDVLREWVAEGRVGPDAELSRDGQAWVLAANMPALFPPTTSRVPGSRSSSPDDDGGGRSSRRLRRR